MMKRIILCVLCLMMVFSACLAEELPAKATCYKIKLNRNIPAETMREVFAEYMFRDVKWNMMNTGLPART